MKKTARDHSESKSISKTKKAFQPKFLIMDDDTVVTSVFKAHLGAHFPWVKIHVSNQPIAEPGYDVYFIDNNFDGKHLAAILIDQIRQLEPQALIVTLSATLDLNALRQLVNLGCNAVYSKQAPIESSDARRVIGNYLGIIDRQLTDSENRNSFSDTVSSLFQLLDAWNRRLGANLAKGQKSA